jgi:hypothetical protein
VATSAGKTHAQQIDVMNHACHGGAIATRRKTGCDASQNRFDGVLHTPVAEIAQERISRAERQETPDVGRSPAIASGYSPFTTLIGSPVAADGNEPPHAAFIGLARDLRGLATSARLGDFDLDASSAQPLQSGTKHFARFVRPPAAGFTIAR